MYHTPAQVIQHHIVSQDLPLLTNPTEGQPWPLFISFLPDDDLKVRKESSAIYDTTPVKDGRLNATGENVLHYGIQLKLRAGTYLDGWQKGLAIIAFLETLLRTAVSIEGHDYVIQNVSLLSGLLPIGRGEVDRGVEFFTANFLVTMKEE